MITVCEELHVLCIHGVGTSIGVRNEILFAREQSIVVRFLEVPIREVKGSFRDSYISVMEAQSKWKVKIHIDELITISR